MAESHDLASLVRKGLTPSLAGSSEGHVLTRVSGVPAWAAPASAASPITEFRFTTDSNTGMDNPAADTIAFITGGTERFRISPSDATLYGAPVGGGAGRNITIVAGDGASTFDGGTLNLKGGSGPNSNGGAVLIQGADGVGTNKNGGTLVVRGGQGAAGGAGGNLTIWPGDGGSGGAAAGELVILGGVSSGSVTGGGITITSGQSTSGAGGAIAMTGGASSSGAGGSITLAGGSSAAGDGGSLSLTASAGFGTNKNGGSVSLTAGAKTGAGTDGKIVLAGVDRVLRLNNQTTGGGASTGTLTNAPASGNPGFWLKINIGGTDYQIPCWAG